MTHAERQAFMKTSPLGQLFGVSHLLPEVEDLMSSNHASTDQAKLVNTLSDNEQKFHYEMLKLCTRSPGKWSKKLLSLSLFLYIVLGLALVSGRENPYRGDNCTQY